MRKLISPECIHKFKIYVVCGWDQIDISIISVILVISVISVISVIPLPPPPGNGGVTVGWWEELVGVVKNVTEQSKAEE